MIWVSDIRLVEALLERIPYEERSLWRAENLGGDDHFGWGLDRMILATIANAANTQVKGKKLRASERIEAPRVVRKGRRPRAGTPVAQMDLSKLFPPGL